MATVYAIRIKTVCQLFPLAGNARVTYLSLLFGLMRMQILSIQLWSGRLSLASGRSRLEGNDVQVQMASKPNPTPSSTQVIQNIFFSLSPSPSSSSSVDLCLPKKDLRPSAASKIVKVTHNIVIEIKADIVLRALMSSSVRLSCAIRQPTSY